MYLIMTSYLEIITFKTLKQIYAYVWDYKNQKESVII